MKVLMSEKDIFQHLESKAKTMLNVNTELSKKTHGKNKVGSIH
jgi:hypothetical protein